MTDDGTADRPGWPIRQFTQGLADGTGRDDIAALLRHVADTIEGLGDVEIQDIVFHQQLYYEDADWPHLTVYYHETDDDEG
jgi:hypothetical protein